MMDAVRRQFEEWQIQPLHWLEDPHHPQGGRYQDDRIEEQWMVWQAATTYSHLLEVSQLRKEAMKLGEKKSDKPDVPHTISLFPYPGVAVSLEFKGCTQYVVNDSDSLEFTDSTGKAHLFSRGAFHVVEE